MQLCAEAKQIPGHVSVGVSRVATVARTQVAPALGQIPGHVSAGVSRVATVARTQVAPALGQIPGHISAGAAQISEVTRTRVGPALAAGTSRMVAEVQQLPDHVAATALHVAAVAQTEVAPALAHSGAQFAKFSKDAFRKLDEVSVFLSMLAARMPPPSSVFLCCSLRTGDKRVTLHILLAWLPVWYV
jgi:hypothetical protein